MGGLRLGSDTPQEPKSELLGRGVSVTRLRLVTCKCVVALRRQVCHRPGSAGPGWPSQTDTGHLSRVQGPAAARFMSARGRLCGRGWGRRGRDHQARPSN